MAQRLFYLSLNLTTRNDIIFQARENAELNFYHAMWTEHRTRQDLTCTSLIYTESEDKTFKDRFYGKMPAVIAQNVSRCLILQLELSCKPGLAH